MIILIVMVVLAVVVVVMTIIADADLKEHGVASGHMSRHATSYRTHVDLVFISSMLSSLIATLAQT